MAMFNRDFFRFFAFGFAAGAVVIFAGIGGQSLLDLTGALAPAAHAAVG